MSLSSLSSPAKRVASALATASGRRASSHGPHYHQPSGYLFGEKPPPAGQARVKADWENIYYWGMGGGMALAGVLIYYKPDTSLATWAKKEAEARMAANGETPTYVKS